MKTKITALIVACGMSISAGYAQSVPIEKDAVISDTKDFPRSKLLGLVDPAVGMIRASGYRCDSISVVRPFLLSRGFTVICNRFSYEYDISDKGGNWIVELQ
jgi:hypothetical protein